MNILVIGNGFDLAHGLPTKYVDFLEWIVAEVEYWKNMGKQRSELVNDITLPTLSLNIPKDRKRKENIHINRIDKQVELWNCINDNVWLEYFLQCDMHGDENWIDFESEISKVIQKLDKDMDGNLYNNIHKLSIPFFTEKFLNDNNIVDESSMPKGKISFFELRNTLLNDLSRLIRALEIYLSNHVSTMPIKKLSPDIKNIEIGYVLSFNYTNTYKKIYGHGKNIKYDFIHGEANQDNTVDTNNMVLGIDEYLPNDRKNIDVEFIGFKKFYQRIYKERGCEYKNWVDEIKRKYMEYTQNKAATIERKKDIGNGKYSLVNIMADKSMINSSCEMHYLYFFGHSLDVTDGDILRDLILNDNVYTTIFYLNKDVMRQQIANLAKVIGTDELIRRTGGSTKTIKFCQQQDMIGSETDGV